MSLPRLLSASAVLSVMVALGTAGAASAEGWPPGECAGNPKPVAMPTTWTVGSEIAKDGAAQESTVTWENTSGYDLDRFQTFVLLPPANPRHSGHDALKVQVKAPGGEWTDAPFGGGPDSVNALTGTFHLAKGATLTLGLRIAATATAPTEPYDFQVTGSAAPIITEPYYHWCSQFTGQVKTTVNVVEHGPTQSPTPTPTTPTPPATTAPPSATATATARGKGPELASTGGGAHALPIAAAGATALALGGGILVALRRRRGSHS